MDRMPDSSAAQTYRAAYARLSQIAAELETGEADLDRILPLLEEAQAAYAQCRGRIDAVRRALQTDWSAATEDEATQDEATED